MENQVDDYQGQNILSSEVHDVLGKKFSWFIRNGNIILLAVIFLIFCVCLTIKIPITIRSKGIANLNNEQICQGNNSIDTSHGIHARNVKHNIAEFRANFLIPIQQINKFKVGEKVFLTLAYIPEKSFEAKIFKIDTKLYDGGISIHAILREDLSKYSDLVISQTPVELELNTGKKNIINYFLF